MAQHVRDRLLDQLPQLDFVVGPDAYRRLPTLLGGDPFVDVRLDRDETYADLAPTRAPGVRAWITIMRGCDKFCSFCVVPYVRGRERSVPADAVLQQVREAAGEGYREVVFLGQTVNAYRDGAADFAALLRAADAVDGIARIRFTSPHPSDMSDGGDRSDGDLPRRSARSSTCRCSRARRRCSRRWSAATAAEEYLELVARLRAAVPGLALSTDIIVGFPGETERDFEATLRAHARGALRQRVHVQVLAPRPHQGGEVGRDRVGGGKGAPSASRDRAAGSASPPRSTPGWSATRWRCWSKARPAAAAAGCAGKTPQFKTAVFPPTGAAAGDLVRVRITDSTAHTLIA